MRYGCKRSRGGDANARLYHGDLNVVSRQAERVNISINISAYRSRQGVMLTIGDRRSIEPITDYCP